MSNVLPDKTSDLIAFCESHAASWAVAPTTLGLSAATVTSFTALTKSTRDSLTAQTSAKEAAKASTTALNTNASKVRAMAADLVRTIKAFAEMQTDPGAIYAAAQIPQPALPTPAQAPGKPTNIQVQLESTGAITVSWDASDASASSGGFFQVMRKLPGQSEFSNLTLSQGTTSRERRCTFTDPTVPTSAAGAGVQYIMQGRRGIMVGEASDAIIVQFGVDGSGLSVSSAGEGSLKMAA